MPWVLTIFFILLSSKALADTSVFRKIAVLRFVHEQVVQLTEGEFDLAELNPQEFYHVQGSAYFVPGAFIDPMYWDKAGFQQFIQSNKAITAELKLKTAPRVLEGTSETFGTFIIRVHNTKSLRLAIALPRLFHATEVSYADAKTSRQLIVAGKLDKNPAHNKNFNDMTVTVPVIDVDGDFYLFAKVSSPIYKGRNTINLSSFYIGHEAYINNIAYMTRFFATLVSGSFLVLSIFYSFIFSFRRQDLSSLYLALYAFGSFLLSLIYVVNVGITPQQVLDIFTVINLFGICFLQFYLLDKLSFLYSARTLKILMVVCLAIAGGASIAVVLEIGLMVAALFALSFLSSTAMIFVTLYLGLKHRLNGILFFLAGTILNCSFQFPIMLTYISSSNSENGYNILLANFCMALALALVNAKEFAATYLKSVVQSQALEEKNKEITFFNKNLEKIVDSKTKEIRSLLDYIPQGVLSLAEEGIISKDFSAHLRSILGTDSIALQSFKTLVLDHCDLSSDASDQAWQTITASVGDYLFNFEVNADKLPQEIIYHRDGVRKYLKLTWNIEVDNDIVVRLLVTLLDISAEKELEKEAESQRKELALIQELINVAPSKIAQFFSTCIPLLKENERIVEFSKVDLTASSIRMLFVNAHTVKGAARTLHLKDLARHIHDMEDYYADILKHGATIVRERLREDIKEAFRILDRYIDINRNKLNRSDNYSKIVIERDFMEHHYFFIKDMIKDPPIEVHEIISWLREQNEALTNLIFEQLPATFDNYKEQALKIAKDLGKGEPHFDFNIDEVSISPDQRIVLDNCMVHLLRNALDHGIETPEERRARNKPESGTLYASTTVLHDELKIYISDDGRGLAMNRLRAKGIQQGIISAQSSDQDVANIIFASGVSTAFEVSDISGRGVGMSAVQTFLEKAGASISVKLGDPKDPHGEYRNFFFEIKFSLTPMTLAKVS